MKKVGMVFNVSTSAARDYTLSAFEVRTMAECQARYGPTSVTAVVMMLEDEDEDGEVTKSVSFEPFQVSEQCVRLFRDGWWRRRASSRDGRGVDAFEQRGDRGGQGVEGRHRGGQRPILSAGEDPGPRRAALDDVPRRKQAAPDSNRGGFKRRAASGGKPYAERLRDFHLLLFLSKHLDPADMAMVATQANKAGGEIQEGHKIIIDSLAGM